MTVSFAPAIGRWQRLMPVVPSDPVLGAIARCLKDADFRSDLEAEEAAGVYPARAMQRLRAAGLVEILGDCGQGEPRFTSPHIFAVNAAIARSSGSLGITAGVNMLGLLPIHLGASAPQLEALASRVRAGAAVALLLTEQERGSDLKANVTSAEPGTLEGSTFMVGQGRTTHYRVSGAKHLINAAAQSELLVTLVRTRSDAPASQPHSLLGAAGDMSVLVISPGPGVKALPRHRTLPMHGADIGGVHFDGAIVPMEQRLGDEGEGFALIQRALTLSRGGIGALASGTSSRALALARRYARARELYGAPIVALDPIAMHLVRADALDLAIACLSVKATCLVNAFGAASAHYTAIAKYACCELAEQVVDEGRRVLSAGALIAGEYERVVRDVLLYAVFDGTRHVMLQQIQARLRQLVTRPNQPATRSIELLRRAYSAAPARITEVGRRREPALLLDPAMHARVLSALPGDVDLQPVAALADSLRAVVSALLAHELWQADQESAFVCARVLAWIEAALAVAELADPARRRALSLPDYSDPAASERARFAVGQLGGRAAAELRALVGAHGLCEPPELAAAEVSLWRATGTAEAALRHLQREGTVNDDD